MKDEAVKRSAQIALAVAALLGAGACASTDKKDVAGKSEALVCVGGNECKGMSECSGGPSDNACQGMNECKGMGWSYVDTAEECDDAGGKVKT